MSGVFELVCDRLGVKNRKDAFAEKLAGKIIRCRRASKIGTASV